VRALAVASTVMLVVGLSPSDRRARTASVPRWSLGVGPGTVGLALRGAF
jgi:hypothetical protein